MKYKYSLYCGERCLMTLIGPLGLLDWEVKMMAMERHSRVPGAHNHMPTESHQSFASKLLDAEVRFHKK